MTILLICNVGTRDVQLDDLSVLPEDVRDSRGAPLARPAGEHLRQPDVCAQHSSALRMPMVEKALQYICPHDKAPVHIHLFATDQPETVPAHFRQNDTCTYAALMRDLLFTRYERAGLLKKHIGIHTTASNPADYDLMYDFYRAELPRLQARYPQDSPRVYLLIAGGTPQMNTMLLFVGSEVFGGQAQPIYVSPDRDRAATLDILRQLYAQALRRNLTVLLEAYAYRAARTLLAQQPDVLEPWQEQLLAALLTHADARRNLDLPAAVQAFDHVQRSTRALREDLRALQQDVAANTEPLKLQETIYLAQIASETGNWADFLARLYRFSEGTLQLLAEQVGVRWSDPKKRASYQSAWWDAQRAVLHQLGLADADKPADPEVENPRRKADRTNMRKIVGALSQQAGAGSAQQALAALEVVDQPVALRNDIVHRFTPISVEEVEWRAKATVPEILAQMRLAYQAAFGVVVPEAHPYRLINDVCQRVLGGER